MQRTDSSPEAIARRSFDHAVEPFLERDNSGMFEIYGAGVIRRGCRLIVDENLENLLCFLGSGTCGCLEAEHGGDRVDQ